MNGWADQVVDTMVDTDRREGWSLLSRQVRPILPGELLVDFRLAVSAVFT